MKNYNKSSTMLHALNLMRENRKLRAELKEHRYYLEKNVACRTEHLSRHIVLLESCNQTLCGKLAMLKKGLAAAPVAVKKPVDSTVKLYLLNSARVA
ncbi:MAG: hypothetical protein NTY60_00250 [Proteobacteria bacterium]|nr:hypothetical protein [Pseudomonadota bacterium]